MKYILLLLCLCSSLFSGQKITGMLSFPPMEYKADTLERGIHNVYYEVSFVKNVEKLDKRTEAVGLLQIGEKYSKFADIQQLKTDSLSYEFSKLETNGAKEANLLFSHLPKWKIVTLTNKPLRKASHQEYVTGSYQYEEDMPVIDWKIEKEKKEILGYACRKATASFRGRKYTAWYAESLPISEGPYLFGGLPGLIMEVYDHKEHYHFTAIAMDTKEFPIYIRKDKSILKTTRDKFRTLKQSYHQNPGFYMKSKAYNADGSEIQMKMKEIPYNPIELQ